MFGRGSAGRAFLVGSLMLIGHQLAAQGSSVTVRPLAPSGGAIAGFVRDTTGAPIEGVRIVIEGLARQTRSSATGGFALEALPAGTYSLRFRKLGYAEAQASLTVIADSATTVGVMMASLAEQMDAMVIEATVLNQVTGLVTDESGTPLPGVVVEILGLGIRLETNAQGRYVLLDLKPGNYLLQFRAPGYRVSQYGLRMVAQIERDITTKLNRARAGDRMTAAVAASVSLEATRRQSLRGGQSMLLGRDELERYDTQPLGDALQNTRANLLLPTMNTDCVLVNGHEPLSTATAAEILSGQAGTRSGGFTAAQAGRFGGTAPSDALTARNARVSSGWLNFFRANEVELLEIYAPGSENSRTVCGRFPVSSGCSCPPDPSAIIIWLRR